MDLERLLELELGNTEAKAMLPNVRKEQKVADKASKKHLPQDVRGLR